MFFDPISSWLVVLIADGVVASWDKGRSGAAASGYEQKHVKQANAALNGDIRRVKNKYGLNLPEMAYEQIKLHINITRNSFSFQHANGQIVLDLDNQEYIIALLEACSKWYGKHPYGEDRKKAEWYKNAAIEARRQKDLYTQELEENRIREAEQREKEQALSNIYVVVGLTIFVAFIILITHV